jgi:hypothetical protein
VRPGEPDADALHRLIRELLGVDAAVGGVAWVDYSARGAERFHVATTTDRPLAGVAVPIGSGLDRLRPLGLRDLLLQHGDSIAAEAAALA